MLSILGIPVSPTMLNGGVRSFMHVTHLPLHLSFCGKKAIGFENDDKSSLFSYASLAYDETPIIKLPILPFCGLQTTPFLQNLQIPAEVFATDY
jgi:hypothetical protein